MPVFSWIFLKGKCRSCGAAIGWCYPVIELATLFLCLIFYFRFGISPRTLALIALSPVIVSLIDIDFRYKIIPDVLNLAILFIGIAAIFMPGGLIEPGDWIAALQGSLLYGLFFLALRQVMTVILRREPLGWGDIKFFAAAGVWLGPSLDLLAQFMFLSGFFGVSLALVWRKIKKEPEFPFGPAIILSFMCTLLWQPDFFSIYVK